MAKSKSLTVPFYYTKISQIMVCVENKYPATEKLEYVN